MGCAKSKQIDESVIDHTDAELSLDSIEHDSIRNRTVSIRNCAIESVYDGVHDGKTLGIGIGGLVRLVTHRVAGTEFALKTLCLDQLNEGGIKQVQEEVATLMELDHPNIVKLDGVYHIDNEIHLVQELCSGGDLFDRLDKQPEEHYSEAECIRLIKQILSAVRYIHSKGIVHRDLKLENFLFQNESLDSELKMIDFGLSRHFKSGDMHHEPVGTRYTVAPEVYSGCYDEKVDIWAIGVIAYLLLSGVAPFGGCYEGERYIDVKSKVLKADFAFEPIESWKDVSQQAKDFISCVLVTDPAKRPTAEECQRSEWLMERTKRDRDNLSLNPNVIKALRSFRNFSELRKLLCEVIGFTLLPEQMALLRNDFEKLDVEQTGEISLGGLKRVLIANAENGLLGSYDEREVVEIFNALRLHDSDTTIHWHHFLAAGLSELPVDERNHMLAFDKIDQERKGYITVEDIMKICPEKLKATRSHSIEGEWSALCRTGSRIQYEDFVKIVEIEVVP